MPPPAGIEQNLQRLEAIVAELEHAELPLEKSVGLFEEGMKLVEDCRQQLDAAEGKVEMLVRRAGAARATTEPFTLNEDDESA